jgi:hypothetical protein
VNRFGFTSPAVLERCLLTPDMFDGSRRQESVMAARFRSNDEGRLAAALSRGSM